MKKSIEKNELFQASHLSILACFTIFSVILIGESLLLGWEKWVLVLIVAAVVFCWGLHIRHTLSDTARLWIYSMLMMSIFFFYGIHRTSVFDLATVMTAVIILYTMTGMRSLVTLCQISYMVTMGYGVTSMILAGEEFDSLVITRILLHIAMIIMTGQVAKLIIDKWIRVLNRSSEEIENLTDATDRLNDFLANVSHEIRTPVNAVIGLSGICAEKTAEPELKKNMTAVNEAGRRIAEQISDILDYSEIDRKKLARNDEEYMISSVVNDLVGELRQYKPDRLELIIDIDPSIPSVMETDVGKLKKIMRHLIVNGLKYTREGGVYVRIFTIHEEYGVNLCIEVSDTGIGMTSEEIERIAERFYQADSGRSRSSGGLGLGMAIVSGFVASLGGFMRLNSRYGAGTSVNVSIPQKVINETGSMSVADIDKLCLGAFLHFEKFADPQIREYYNIMVRNIVKGLGVQMHRVDNEVNLRKLLATVRLTHLFVGEEEYKTDPALMERLSSEMIVIVVADSGFSLPAHSRVRIMEKPFYCFPVAALLNEGTELEESSTGRMYCKDVRVLVVDDEPMNLIVAKNVFAKYGMTVETALSGPEAVSMCAGTAYDIIFMDHMMPGMDGIETTKRIRSDPKRARNDVPVVALTANAVSTAKEMFLKEGFDGFVSKPIDLVELERVLKKVLPKSRIVYENGPENDKHTQTASSSAGKQAPPAPEEAAEETSSPYDILAGAGIDTAAGLGYCMNDEDFYKTLLIQFSSEYKEKLSAVTKAFENKDLKNYEIIVHALKSTSKMIGCMELSEKAKALEFAAKEHREEYIAENHVPVMALYEKVTESIGKACGLGSGTASDEVMEFAPAGEAPGEVMEFSPAGSGVSDEIIEFSPEDDNK